MAIRFILNGEARAETDVPPGMTVLDYLRGIVRLTGTKEGCAEGDCGACTIAVRETGAPDTPFRAVNSCLMSVPQLDGCEVKTVEGLASDQTLHPVQQALAEGDGTQCGFCTPGFVMSMFAFQQGGEPADDNTVHEALAGNLCRCTGYRPIVDACRAIAAQPRPITGLVAAITPCEEYRHADQVCFLPRSLDGLVALRAQHPDAVIFAGGTDLGLLLSKQRKRFPAVILTSRVQELMQIVATPDALTLGAAVTYSQALPQLENYFPAFGALVRRIGSRQIRNLGTFAGNLATASPIGDTLPCLIALGAQVVLHSNRGARAMAVEDFILGYRKTALAANEVISTIRIPALPKDESFAAYKLSRRFDQDISTVVAAFRLRHDEQKIARLHAVYGGMAATVARARSVEDALAGKAWSAESLAGLDVLIARDFSPMTDQRGTANYRLRAAFNLLRRFQIESTDTRVPVRVEAL